MEWPILYSGWKIRSASLRTVTLFFNCLFQGEQVRKVMAGVVNEGEERLEKNVCKMR